MQYSKYFISGQKVFLKRLGGKNSQARFDSLTGYVVSCDSECIRFSLPYGTSSSETYPFEPGMEFEMLTDHLGMGVRLVGKFVKQPRPEDIQLEIAGILEFYPRRLHRRVDVNAWIGFRTSTGNLRSMRDEWEKNVQRLQEGTSAKKLTEFAKHKVSLGSGGIRFTFAAPVKTAELVLVFISIGDGKGIICALAEVVWAKEAQDGENEAAGLRFLNILEDDQQRIDVVVNSLCEKLEKNP